MKTLSLALAVASMSNFAQASPQDGTYRCKNKQGLPDNVYTERTVSLGNVSVPHIEAARYFHRDPANPNPPVEEARLLGCEQ